MSFDLDQEEELSRETAADHAATSSTIKCGDLTLRKMSMATYVMLCGTNNIFFTAASNKKRAFFDAAAFVWMHAESPAIVFSTDWQDPKEFTAVVTEWMSRFGGSEIAQFVETACKERDRYLASEFRILPSDLGGAQKKTKPGQRARSGTSRT